MHKYYKPMVAICFMTVMMMVNGQAISQTRTRIMKANASKGSQGLRVPTTVAKCLNSNDPSCNPNTPSNNCPSEQILTNGKCICKDTNMMLNPTDITKCIPKTSEIAMSLKRDCTKTLIQGVSKECETSYLYNGKGGLNNDEYKCYDPNELYAFFNTRLLNIYVDGKSLKYDEFCSEYTEDLLKSISTEYDPSGENSLACKVQRATADATSECFSLVLSTGKALGATDNLAGQLEQTCGKSGIQQKYIKLFGTSIPAGMTFPTDIADLFKRAGKLNMSHGSVEYIGKLMDGKITDKSDTWEREITVIANSQINKVAQYCGQEYATSTHDENIAIVDTTSSFQRAIDDGGLVKGTSNWTLNQASVLIGENKVDKIKKEGWVKGGVKNSEMGATELTITTITSPKVKDELKSQTNGLYFLISDTDYIFVEKEDDTLTKKKYSEIKDNISKENLEKMLGKTEKDITI